MEIEKCCLPDRFISFLSSRRDGNSLENYFSIFRSFEQYDLTTMLLNNATGLSDPGGRLGHGPFRFFFKPGRGEADYAHYITTCSTPRFSDLPTALRAMRHAICTIEVTTFPSRIHPKDWQKSRAAHRCENQNNILISFSIPSADQLYALKRRHYGLLQTKIVKK